MTTALCTRCLRAVSTSMRRHKDSGEGFGRLPDLILLDGGAGQVSAVQPVLDRFGLHVPLFGMVKDNRHRTRAIALNGGEIEIRSNRRVFTLISDIQEEVHRYSVAYHHNRHTKRTLSMSLYEIDGIGEKKARALLRRLKRSLLYAMPVWTHCVQQRGSPAKQRKKYMLFITERKTKPYEKGSRI